ncbi:MAG: TRAP transporter substrate-binding protein [Elusimicrobiota bacterium]|jgi:tripartite ATP-independent transporter DctP family solute receptor|nr:TRAP transporter substrate-binding protein [Elusimicrobiota bacterium]
MNKLLSKTKLFSVLVFALILAFGLTSCGGKKKDVLVLKIGLADPVTSNYGKGALRIAEEVKKATNGRIEIEVLGSSQYGNERDMYEGAQLGTVDIATFANAVLSGFIPEVAILDQPFLFNNADEAHKAIDGKFGDMIKEKAQQQNVHIVGWMESGFRNVFSKRPVQTVADFKGLKIRTMENKTHMAFFGALGAIPTPMASGEQFTALQQGTIDAAENATANVLANKYYEVVKNITRTQHVFVYIGIGVSDKAWKQIPDDLKQPFIDAVKRGADYQRQLLVEANNEAEVELVKLGVTFYDIDRAALQKAVAPAMAPFIKAIPKEWINTLNESKK